jgi:hypothetical protein
MKHKAARRTWEAMLKFSNDEALSERDWDALSWATLIDRGRLAFEPGNVRVARSQAERADNLVFYRSLGAHTVH